MSEPRRFKNSWGTDTAWGAQEVNANGEPIGEPVNGLEWIMEYFDNLDTVYDPMILEPPPCDNCGGGDAYPFTILETQFHLCPSCTKMIAVSALRKTPDYEHQIKLTLLSQRAARNADGKQHAES